MPPLPTSYLFCTFPSVYLMKPVLNKSFTSHPSSLHLSMPTTTNLPEVILYCYRIISLLPTLLLIYSNEACVLTVPLRLSGSPNLPNPIATNLFLPDPSAALGKDGYFLLFEIFSSVCFHNTILVFLFFLKLLLISLLSELLVLGRWSHPISQLHCLLYADDPNPYLQA